MKINKKRAGALLVLKAYSFFMPKNDNNCL